jgi:hypothetical protein
VDDAKLILASALSSQKRISIAEHSRCRQEMLASSLGPPSAPVERTEIQMATSLKGPHF